MAHVSLKKIDKHYDTYHAVRGIDLEIPENAFVVLVGPSGCGKSTTLRMIAGLEEITDGSLEIGGARVNDLSPAQRDIAMVFQNYALYPHMTVRSNIAFGLQQRRTDRAEIRRRVAEVARLLEIEPLLDRKPRALSGGQRQRVAMGRAMVRNPSVFLFDEPLSNLDAKLRVQMRTEIKRLHQVKPTTTVYVTHDQIEAMTLADIVVVMNQGRIEQIGAPQELYLRPKTGFVAQFIGSPSMNFVDVQLRSAGGGLEMVLDRGDLLKVPADRTAAYAPFTGRKMILGIRPEALGTRDGGAGALPVTVDVVEPIGQEILVFFKLGSRNCSTRMDPTERVRPGDRLTLCPQMTRAHLIDPETDKVVPVPYLEAVR